MIAIGSGAIPAGPVSVAIGGPPFRRRNAFQRRLHRPLMRLASWLWKVA